MNGEMKRGTTIQWNINIPQYNKILMHTANWMNLENIYFKCKKPVTDDCVFDCIYMKD